MKEQNSSIANFRDGWWWDKLPEGLVVGALWLGKGLMETNCGEFSTFSSIAGITARLLLPLDAMWHDALVTKTKQRKIARCLFDWFGLSITAKLKDVDVRKDVGCRRLAPASL
jgi:hypothetical protein